MAWSTIGTVIPGLTVQFYGASTLDLSRATLRFTASSLLQVTQEYDVCLDVGSGSGLFWFAKLRMEPGYKGVLYVDTPAAFAPFTTAKVGIISPPALPKVVGLSCERWV